MASETWQQAVCRQVALIMRRERERCGLSMNQVAKRSGLSQQMVSYVERGMRNPTLETLLRMTAALQIDLAKVIERAQRDAEKGGSE